MWTRNLLVVIGAATLAAGAAEAQSLADVARQEEARRGAAAPAGKVYTNGNLKPDPTAPAPSAIGAGEAAANQEKGAAPESSADESGKAAVDAPAETGTPAPGKVEEPFWRVESYWRDQADVLRAKLSLRNADVLALRQRLAALLPASNEFRVTEGALKSATASLDAANAEWRRLEDLARIRKVPDAWIR